MAKVTNTADPAMARVRELWEAKQAEGWTMQRLGEAMGYNSESARKSVSQFLKKSRRPQLSMLQRFAEALGVNITELMPGQDKSMSTEKVVGPTEDGPRAKNLPYNPIESAMRTPEHAR